MEQTDKYAEALAAFRHLLEIMDELREKCPWDRAQTFETLRNLTVEETFELADAIMDKDYPDMCKELGDLQLHIVFYAKVASEMGLFNVTDVLNKLCDKLIRRHPHIYGEMKADSANEVHENWEKIANRSQQIASASKEATDSAEACQTAIRDIEGMSRSVVANSETVSAATVV